MIKNNKAQGMSTSTIILLVLGLIILVILVLGFTMGWNKISPFVKQNNNIDQVKTACNVACSTGGTYEYCTVLKTVNDGNNTEFQETCYGLATKSDYTDRGYGIASCPQVDCGSSQ
jgi:hypothetical protein